MCSEEGRKSPVILAACSYLGPQKSALGDIDRDRINNQEKLIKDGSFVNTIAVAFSRMPSVQRLEILNRNVEDTLIKFDYNCLTTSNIDEGFFEAMIAQNPWKITEEGDVPIQLLVRLPGAIHKAGDAVKSLSIQMLYP